QVGDQLVESSAQISGNQLRLRVDLGDEPLQADEVGFAKAGEPALPEPPEQVAIQFMSRARLLSARIEQATDVTEVNPGAGGRQIRHREAAPERCLQLLDEQLEIWRGNLAEDPHQPYQEERLRFRPPPP